MVEIENKLLPAVLIIGFSLLLAACVDNPGLINQYNNFTNPGGNSGTLVQELCLSDSATGITCNAKAAVDPQTNNVQMAVTNGAGTNIKITSITATGSSCMVSSWDAMNSTGQSIKNDQIGSGQAFKLSVNCNSISGSIFKDTFTIRYTDTDNNLVEQSRMEVVAKIGSGSSSGNSGGTLQPEKCTMAAGISCNNFGISLNSQNRYLLSLELTNQMGHSINISNITVTGNSGLHCTANLGTTGVVPNGNKVQVKVDVTDCIADKSSSQIRFSTQMHYTYTGSTIPHVVSGEVIITMPSSTSNIGSCITDGNCATGYYCSATGQCRAQNPTENVVKLKLNQATASTGTFVINYACSSTGQTPINYTLYLNGKVGPSVLSNAETYSGDFTLLPEGYYNVLCHATDANGISNSATESIHIATPITITGNKCTFSAGVTCQEYGMEYHPDTGKYLLNLTLVNTLGGAINLSYIQASGDNGLKCGGVVQNRIVENGAAFHQVIDMTPCIGNQAAPNFDIKLDMNYHYEGSNIPHQNSGEIMISNPQPAVPSEPTTGICNFAAGIACDSYSGIARDNTNGQYEMTLNLINNMGLGIHITGVSVIGSNGNGCGIGLSKTVGNGDKTSIMLDVTNCIADQSAANESFTAFINYNYVGSTDKRQVSGSFNFDLPAQVLTTEKCVISAGMSCNDSQITYDAATGKDTLTATIQNNLGTVINLNSVTLDAFNGHTCSALAVPIAPAGTITTQQIVAPSLPISIPNGWSFRISSDVTNCLNQHTAGIQVTFNMNLGYTNSGANIPHQAKGQITAKIQSKSGTVPTPITITGNKCTLPAGPGCSNMNISYDQRTGTYYLKMALINNMGSSINITKVTLKGSNNWVCNVQNTGLIKQGESTTLNFDVSKCIPDKTASTTGLSASVFYYISGSTIQHETSWYIASKVPSVNNAIDTCTSQGATCLSSSACNSIGGFTVGDNNYCSRTSGTSCCMANLPYSARCSLDNGLYCYKVNVTMDAATSDKALHLYVYNTLGSDINVTGMQLQGSNGKYCYVPLNDVIVSANSGFSPTMEASKCVSEGLGETADLSVVIYYHKVGGGITVKSMGTVNAKVVSRTSNNQPTFTPKCDINDGRIQCLGETAQYYKNTGDGTISFAITNQMSVPVQINKIFFYNASTYVNGNYPLVCSATVSQTINAQGTKQITAKTTGCKPQNSDNTSEYLMAVDYTANTNIFFPQTYRA